MKKDFYFYMKGSLFCSEFLENKFFKISKYNNYLFCINLRCIIVLRNIELSRGK